MDEQNRIPGYGAELEVVAYDPAWPAQFECEAERINDLLGDELARIEHLGSTSIPELPAKPIIDIGVVMTDMCCVRDRVEPLTTIGYQFGADRDGWLQLHRWDNGQQFNVGVCSHDSERWRQNLMLREYLRDHPGARNEYAAVKRKAAEEHPRNAKAYNDAKSETIESIIQRARTNGYEERI